MFVDQKRFLKATSVLGQRRLLRVGQEGQELGVGCVPERAWSFDVCSGVAGLPVTATSVALGLPGLSAEIDGHRFIVLSALTDGESFDVVMSAGGDHGFESWRKLHRRWDPYTAGRARSLLREILSPSRVKLPELMGAVERMEDLVRRYCGRRDAQGNVHSLAEDISMSSLPDDLEKHVQLNRARLNSCGVLREEIKTYCEW